MKPEKLLLGLWLAARPGPEPALLRRAAAAAEGPPGPWPASLALPVSPEDLLQEPVRQQQQTHFSIVCTAIHGTVMHELWPGENFSTLCRPRNVMCTVISSTGAVHQSTDLALVSGHSMPLSKPKAA
jgi:hypothetical protein